MCGFSLPSLCASPRVGLAESIAEADFPPGNSDVLLIIATFGLSGIWRGIVDFSWSWSSFASYGVTYLLAWIRQFGFSAQPPLRRS